MGTRMNVKIPNELNVVGFSDLTDMELRIFFYLYGRIQNTEEETLELTYKEVREACSYTKTSKKRFESELLNIKRKMVSLVAEVKNGSKTAVASLLPYIEHDSEADILTVAKNKKFEEFLEGTYFTAYDVMEIIEVKGVYPKLLYSLLKQWRTTNGYKGGGKNYLSIEEVKEKFNLPKSYKKTSTINERVLYPAFEAVKPYFEDFKVEAVKEGRTILGFRITFKPEEKTPKYKYYEAGKESRAYEEVEVMGESKEPEKVESPNEVTYSKPKKKYTPKKNKGVKTSYRKETLPDWARDDAEPVKETPLSEEEQQAFRERLKKIRSYRKDQND